MRCPSWNSCELITEPTREAPPEPQVPSGTALAQPELRNRTPGVFSTGTEHFLCRRELAERLISCSYDLLLKLPIKWKYVKPESFICLLSFSNAAFLWTYTYLTLWNTDVYPEMRRDGAVSYTKWIKFPTEMDFVPLECAAPGWALKDEWLLWSTQLKAQEMGKIKAP